MLMKRGSLDARKRLCCAYLQLSDNAQQAHSIIMEFVGFFLPGRLSPSKSSVINKETLIFISSSKAVAPAFRSS